MLLIQIIKPVITPVLSARLTRSKKSSADNFLAANEAVSNSKGLNNCKIQIQPYPLLLKLQTTNSKVFIP